MGGASGEEQCRGVMEGKPPGGKVYGGLGEKDFELILVLQFKIE